MAASDRRREINEALRWYLRARVSGLFICICNTRALKRRKAVDHLMRHEFCLFSCIGAGWLPRRLLRGGNMEGIALRSRSPWKNPPAEAVVRREPSPTPPSEIQFRRMLAEGKEIYKKLLMAGGGGFCMITEGNRLAVALSQQRPTPSHSRNTLVKALKDVGFVKVPNRENFYCLPEHPRHTELSFEAWVELAYQSALNAFREYQQAQVDNLVNGFLN